MTTRCGANHLGVSLSHLSVIHVILLPVMTDTEVTMNQAMKIVRRKLMTITFRGCDRQTAGEDRLTKM